MKHINVIGIDIAKEVFHLVGLERSGKQVLKKKLSRKKLIAFIEKLPSCLIAMEGCGSAHYWAREFSRLGHQVKLLPAQYVKAYVRGNKNDYNDALAIAEASQVSELRAVSIKTPEQQSLQGVIKMRASQIKTRTALCNQMRGLLQEFGYTIPLGIHKVRQRVLDILSTETALTSLFKEGLELNYLLLCRLDEQIDQLTQMIERHSRQHPEIKRLQSIPGFGPLVASAFFNAVGDGSGFKRGRDVSAAIGLVPKQHSTGGRSILLGISKRGDGYLRSLIVHGARAVVAQAARKSDALSCWINQLVERRGKHKAIVALANKLARIAWAVLTTGKAYQADYQFA